MNARDELAAVIDAADDAWDKVVAPSVEWAQDMADAILAAGYAKIPTADYLRAAGWVKPRTITTTEELDTLPERSLLLSCSEYPRYAGTVWRVCSGRVIEKVGREPEGVTPFGYFKDPLPALVIHEPEATR